MLTVLIEPCGCERRRGIVVTDATPLLSAPRRLRSLRSHHWSLTDLATAVKLFRHRRCQQPRHSSANAPSGEAAARVDDHDAVCAAREAEDSPDHRRNQSGICPAM